MPLGKPVALYTTTFAIAGGTTRDVVLTK